MSAGMTRAGTENSGDDSLVADRGKQFRGTGVRRKPMSGNGLPTLSSRRDHAEDTTHDFRAVGIAGPDSAGRPILARAIQRESTLPSNPANWK